MRVIFGASWGFIFAASLFISTQASAESIGFSLIRESDESSKGRFTVSVLDDRDGSSIADATVSVADSLSTSHAEVSEKTDSNGVVVFRLQDDALRAVSVIKEGYGAVSVVGVKNEKIVFSLKPVTADTPPVIGSGILGGWKNPSGKDFARAGAVFRSLSAFDLLQFQIEAFISPIKDTIDVLGPRKIPSNIVLPDQNVSLPVGTIHLDKPQYRLPVEANRSVMLSGIQGEIRVSDVLPAFQNGGKFSFEMLDKLKFTRVGLSSVIETTNDFREDFDTILNLGPKHEVRVSRPPFAADVIVSAATDLRGDRQVMIPTDIKSAARIDQPNQIRTVYLSAPTQSIGYAQDVVTFAISDRGRRISGIVTERAGKVVSPGEFLTAAEPPQMGEIPPIVSIQAPAHGLGAAVFQSGGGQALWTVYALPQVGQVQVPSTKYLSRAVIQKYSVIQLEFGRGFNEKELDGSSVMRSLERFTRTSASKN